MLHCSQIALLTRIKRGTAVTKIEGTSFGSRLRTIRKSKGLTQQELAKGICTKSFVSQIERGQVSPSLRILEQLRERLGVPWSTLLDDDESLSPADWLVEELMSIVSTEQSPECTRCRQLSRKTLSLAGEDPRPPGKPGPCTTVLSDIFSLLDTGMTSLDRQ